jgi:hypothetical protein
MDFIGPLPEDEGYNCILSMTDHLGADIRMVPTRASASVKDVAALFFENWYCENGLPGEIISDWDKLFVAQFWRALHKLTGVHLKMSTSYHPQTDGSSECTNKTVNQCIRYHVERNQKGWVWVLPLVRFHMMNNVNASTGYSGFQLHIGRSPRVVPPLVQPTRDESKDEQAARKVIENIERCVEDAKDCLLKAKVEQEYYSNVGRADDEVYKVGDKVMLSMLNRRREYVHGSNKEKRVAKFLPRFDGPYMVTEVMPQFSAYTIDMLNQLNVFNTFHASQLK